ncbi:MAG: C40 family peptidase [Micrococcales bacterium]|nr:C40 family peptidase [Micrococcales bacterium]
MTGAVAAVQARIAQIQQSVVPVTTPVLGSVGAIGGTTSAASAAGASSAAGVSSASDATFAAALAELTGTGSAVGASDAGAVVAGAGGAGAATGEDLVAAARQYLGVPYVWGGESLDEGGLDCSGLVLRSLADLGVTGVPRVARDQATLGTEVPSLDQALPGDLVVLSGGSHIGIYVGDGKMIDAPKPGSSVTVRDVYAEPTTIRRVLPQSGAPSATTALTGALASSSAGRTALALLAGSGSTSSLTSSLWGAAS